MRNIFKRKELFSIRKISVGVASVIIGASMLSGVQPLGKTEVQAKENIEVEATQDVQIKVVEHEGRALIKITATKDISNVDIKITLDGQKVTTYHVDKLKAGKSITKELTKAQLDRVKESLAKKIKTLPNTAVVRKSVEQTFSIDKSNLKVAVSYDIEEGTVVPNKPEVKPGEPSKPGQPDVKPEGPSKPGQPDVKPEGPSKPGNPDVKPEEPSNPEQPSNPGNPDTKPEEPSNPGTKPEVKRTKAVVEPVFVTKGTEPVLANLTFQFTNVKHPEEVVEQTTNLAMLGGEELYLDEEYKLTLKDNAGYTFSERLVKAKKEGDFVVLQDANTNETIETLSVKEKTSGSENPGEITLDKLVAKVVTKDDRPFGDVPFRLFEFDSNIPNIVKEAKTNSSGELTLDAKSLKPNTKYDLRIQKKNTPFLRDNVVFTTDKDGKIKTIDNKAVTQTTTGIIEFKEEKVNDNEAKMTKARFKVVDEQGNPVKGVELSASGIKTKITTLKNSRSDENGIVTLDLESKVNGVNYIVNVSKNDQFNWQFKPEAVSLFVTEEGKVNYTSGDYKTFNYNGENIPVFVVKKIDLNHLKTKLQEKIKEAEEVLKTREIKELRDILNSAKEELAKPETLPIYVGGYLNDLTKALEKIKNQPEQRTKVVVDSVFVSKETEPVFDTLTFQFTNVKHPEEVVEKTTNQGTLSGEELYLDEEYKLTLKDNAGYTFNERLVKVKNLDGYMVLHDANTNESIQTLLVKEKTSGSENPGDASNQALRNKLEELVKRELRTEAGYIANQGNQIANNAWISAKTDAERVLKNDSATKEELEAAIKNLGEKIYEAVLGSEKVKVEKLIRAENRLDLIPKLRKAKTLEEVLELKKLVKPEDEATPEGPNKPGEKPGKPEGTPGGTPGTTPEKPGNGENGNNSLPSAKPVINSYSFDDKVVESAGGEVNVTIKGENLTADNVKIKVLNPFTAAKEEELSNSITYKKVGDDVVATIKLPANTTSTAKSFNLVFTDALGMKAKATYSEERGENGRVITILPTGKTKQDSVLSFVTISSYQAHHSTDLTTTTTDKGNVSKKTVAHLYGTNLKANVTKVKIIDQNGVEWPIHTTGSNIEASDYPMMVIGKLGNGISGDGTYQEAEIVLPNHLDTDMTFTYVFAPDGVNFDEAHKVTAVVEKTTNVKSAVKRTITVKYQDENGKTLKGDKVLTGYSWFNYNVEKDTIDGYKNVIVKDNKALSGKFGTKDQEIVLVYTNKEVAQPSETEKPAPQEDTLATSKAKLKELADRDLKLEDSYKKASSELQTNWRKARALANRVLAESNNKEEVDNQILALEKAIAAIENSTEASKPSEEKPKEEGNAGNTTKPTKNVDELKTELQKLVEQDPTKEDNYKLKDSLQEKAWKTARAKAQVLLQGEATAEVLEEQVGKLTRALETLKEENKLANDKADKPNTTPESPAPEEKVSEVTSYTGDKAVISKADGKLLVTVNGKNLKASDLSFRFHDGNSWKDVTLKVISEDSNKIVLEFVVPEELINSTATYKISAKYKNQTIKANGAINFKIA